MFNKTITTTFDDFRHVIESCCNYLRRMCTETLESHPDIFTEKYKKIFHVDIIPAALMFVEDELLNKKMLDKDGKKIPWKELAFSKQDIAKIYNAGVSDRLVTPAKAHMSANYDDKGIVQITDLCISINYDILKSHILRNLYRICDFQDIILKSWAQHEAGHILDYILSYDGQPKSRLEKDNKIAAKAIKEHKAWIKSVMPKGSIVLPEDLEKQRIKQYFEMPQESRADQLGGVDRQKVTDWQFLEKEYRITATIKCKKVKDKKPKEEASEDNKES